MFPINLFATLAPNMLAAVAMQAGLQTGAGYYAQLAAVASSAIALNFFLVTALVGLFYGESIMDRYVRHRRLAGPIAINIAVALGAVALYRSAGMGATFFVIGGVLVFAYVMKRVALEREHLARISELAESRGRLVAQLLEAEDRERRALAEILHDDVIQTLLVTRQDLSDTSDTRDAQTIRQIDDVVRSLRGTISATHPSILDRVGLTNAIATIAERYASRARFAVTLEVQDIGSTPYDRLIFSAARELLANAAKHAGAQHVALSICSDDGSILVRVTDDGRGFDPESMPSRFQEGHIGLQSLRERIDAVGGTFLVSSAEEQGTDAVVRLPPPGNGQLWADTGPALTSISQH